MSEVVQIRIEGHPDTWMYRENWERKQGALMPTPTHDQDTFGLGESYAHMYPSGVSRYGEKIADVADVGIAPSGTKGEERG